MNLVKKRVGVILGGFSAERHISVESGRNIYEKLASSTEYEPIAVYLTGSTNNLRFFILPINILLKDNADDIHDYLYTADKSVVNLSLEEVRSKSFAITNRYGKKLSQPREVKLEDFPSIMDFAFIALHGHPGEDGVLQNLLEKIALPYNGSGVESSYLCMNKYLTNKILFENGISVAKQILISLFDWESDVNGLLESIELNIGFPLIAKPVDDGCSAGVEKIGSKEALVQYGNKIFAVKNSIAKKEFLIEELLFKKASRHFLEVTCGLLTHYSSKKEVVYEIFPPSETLAEGEVLSLEEKFLAGEGRNITPARFDKDKDRSLKIEAQVKKTIEKVAIILGIQGYARIDAFVDIFDNYDIRVYIIEANSLPGMTPATCIFHQCILHGYKPIDFISEIIEFGFQKFSRK